MITVHHLNRSRSTRILWLLEELEVPYEIVRYDRDPKTLLAPPELTRIHPLGKSPVVVDGDDTLAESGAIIDSSGALPTSTAPSEPRPQPSRRHSTRSSACAAASSFCACAESRSSLRPTDSSRRFINAATRSSVGGWVEIVDDHTVRGYGLYQANPLVAAFTGSAPGDTGLSPLYFHAVADTPSRAAGSSRERSSGCS